MADDSLDAFAGVYILLQCDFVGCALLEDSAYPDVEALCVFAEHHEIDVARGAISQAE